MFDVLFPYARRRLRVHVEQHAASPEYAALVDGLRAEHARDLAAGNAVPEWSVVSYVEWLMDRDRKSTALKTLQGRIWEEGYARGELVGQVFDDVPRALERWDANRVSVAIFSSGSVLAQRLLFQHSSAGDLTRFLKHYFDTTMGAKTDAESYRRIAAAMKTLPAEIVFVSDVLRELDAARAAGMDTRLSVRPGNHPIADGHDHVVIRTFDELTAAA